MFNLGKLTEYPITIYELLNKKISVNTLYIASHSITTLYIEPIKLEDKIGNYTGYLNYLVVLFNNHNMKITIQCPSETEAIDLLKNIVNYNFED